MSVRNAIASTSRALLVPRRTTAECCCGYVRSASLSTSTKLRAAVRQLRNEDIRHAWIKVVAEGGGLSEIRSKQRVLREVDTSTMWLLQVDEQLMGEDEAAELNLRAGTPRASYAVCKVVNKKEAYTKAKEKAKEQKVRKKITNVEEKEIQVTWGVSVNDLTHKLKRAQSTIDKGGRLALVIVAAKKTKAPAIPERQMFVQMCKQSLGEEEGKLRIWKPEVWEGPKTSVYLQGVVQKPEQQSQEDVAE